jgi:hypothetical protein
MLVEPTSESSVGLSSNIRGSGVARYEGDDGRGLWGGEICRELATEAPVGFLCSRVVVLCVARYDGDGEGLWEVTTWMCMEPASESAVGV